jgi:hypothetical protein
MPLFADWCQCTRAETGQKRLLKYTEKADGRSAISATLPQVMRSHYDDVARIAQDVEQLGYTKAAALLVGRFNQIERI